MKKNYQGVVVPMVTPITNDGKLDVAAVERIVENFVKAGIHPLLMGTTGEGNSVSYEDGRLFVETAAKAAKGKIKIYAGLTGTVVSEQIKQADKYTAAGADVIVATLPSYYSLTPEQMYNYYKTLADSIKGPLMLYNILATTHMSIPIDVVKKLSNHPNIVGLKDSERNEERQAEIIAFAKDRADFSFFCGCAALSAKTLLLGADGIVPSTANFIPQMYQDLFLAGFNGDEAKAYELQNETDEISKICQEGRELNSSLTALKVMLKARGLCEPNMLLPLTRLPEEEEKNIAEKAALVTAQ